MKHVKLLLAAVIASGLPAATQASTLSEAQITAIIKDVKTIDPSKGSRAAILKETLQGDQSLRTGIESRSELLFNDHTITRLGANTHFSFSEGTRNMSLQSGVMLLQVPKGAGGAKIETAAVTAAVTGTTIMIEAGKNYTKLIVLEGECCLWPKNDKKDNKFFKYKHKTCAVAGQEIIMRNGSKDVPDPVWVNLKTLEGTSLLVTGSWPTPLNDPPIQQAADDQKPDDFIPTNLAIIGAGTDVVVVTDQTPQPPGNPPNNPPGPPNIPPQSKYGALPTIVTPNPYVIGGGSVINTDPTVTTGGVISYGRVYRGSFDGNAAKYLLGTASGDFDNAFSDENGNAFPNYGVAAFKFSALTLQQMPSFVMSGNGANDLALIALGDLGFEPTSPTTFDFSQIYDLTLATIGGSLHVNDQTTITGVQHSVTFYNAGTEQITIDGLVDVPNGYVLASTKGDFGGGGQINATGIDISAGNIITLSEDFDDEFEVYTDKVNGVTVTTDNLYDLSLTGNEVDAESGFHGSPFDSEKSNSNLTLTAHSGGDFPGDIHLAGDFYVSNFAAYADNSITTTDDAYISGYDAYFSAGGDVTLTAGADVDYLTIYGNNVSLTSSPDSQYSVYYDTNITASGTATIAGTVSGDTFTINNSTATIITGDGSIYMNSSVTLNATGNVQIDGVVGGGDGAVSNFTSNSGDGIEPLVVLPGTQDFFGTGMIDAETISITSAHELILDNHAVNGVSINPFDDLSELDLTGATIKITSDFNDVESSDPFVTMKLNATGDITIGGVISIQEFDATTGGKFVFTGSPSVEAGAISLTALNYDAKLTQDTPNGDFYTFNEMSSGSSIGALPLELNGKPKSLSISANSITVGDITASETGLSLSLSALQDINSGTGATINNANSVALQVGVVATLTGDGNTEINYNSGQVITGISNLDAYSMTASAITVTGGIPNISNVSLTLASTGTGGITISTFLNVNSLTATAALGDINANNFITTNEEGGDLSLTASNGAIHFGGATVGGDLTTNAYGGDVTVFGGVSVTGGWSAYASGNFTIEIADPSVGGDFNVTAASGAIELDDLVTMNGGSLTLNAATFIHTSNNAEIDGAGNVTLTLGAPAEISETGNAETAYVFFGVPAASEQGGFTPIKIDIFTADYVDATATALKLTSDFYMPDMELDLTSSAGDLTLNGGITTSSFYGTASGVITGTGSITAEYVQLAQGGAATISQSGSTALLYNGITIALVGASEEESYTIALSANPLTLNSALTLGDVNLNLSGGINSQNNSITAQNVTLSGVNTTTDVSGNGTNLSINAYSLLVYGVSLNGVANGHGGTFTTITSGLGSSGSFPGDITVHGPLTANGGGASGAGGSVSLTTQGSLEIDAYVGEGGFADGRVNANGGDAILTSATPGGNGGVVNLTADGDLNINGDVTATTGVNGGGTFTGGKGGTVNLTSNNGTVYIDYKVEVSSSDLVNHRVSAQGGNINVTSHKTSGVAINIDDSGQLNALLNQAAAGPGGKITFVADGGGDIQIKGKVRADHGTIDIQNKGANSGDVTLDGARLSADVVKVATLSPNGTLTIGGGVINGDSAIKLYAQGANGTVNFVGNTSLTGASVKAIAGNTVTIQNGVAVNVTGGAATVYTNNPNYTGSGGNSSTTGVFTGNTNTTTKPFAGRPAF